MIKKPDHNEKLFSIVKQRSAFVCFANLLVDYGFGHS